MCCVCVWSCLTLSPPGSGCTIHGISQARILEWPAMSFSFWSLGMHLNPRVRVWRIFCVLGNYCYLHISGPQRSKAGPSQGRYTLSSLGHFWGQNWWKRKDKIHMKSSRNGSLHCKNLWILCLGLVLLWKIRCGSTWASWLVSSVFSIYSGLSAGCSSWTLGSYVLVEIWVMVFSW